MSRQQGTRGTVLVTGKGKRPGGRARGRLGAAVLAAVLAALAAVVPRAGAMAADGPPAGSSAPATSSAAQVRFFENGNPIGGGTLVAPNWVLTAAHLFDRPDNPSPYSLRFGTVNSSGDASGTANLRQVDRPIVVARQGDMAMVHFAQAVPAGTFIPQLASQPPAFAEPARMYGWGNGTTLNMRPGAVINPDASLEASVMRELGSEPMIYAFPEGIPPITTTVYAVDGDSGSGVFTGAGILTGVHAGVTDNQLGNGTAFRVSWEEPVWSFRGWVQDTISGAGSSSSGAPPNDELRKLLEASDGVSGTPAMTSPPPSLECDDGDPSCTEPATVAGTLTGSVISGVPAGCADVASNSCTLNGDSSFLPGDPVQLTVPAGLQVDAWCTTTAVFTPGSPAQAAVEFSFTNTDPAQPAGAGWWVTSPASVQAGTGSLDSLSACPQ
jgi:hypothetical protein